MIIVIILTVSMAQLRTSTNTCTIVKTIFKLDIRQRTIKDLNASALCQEAYMYDYIWLTQLWTPGEYNYKNVNGTPQQTNDYRELQSIKEYSMDPSLGMLTELYQLQTNIKVYCPHISLIFILCDFKFIEKIFRPIYTSVFVKYIVQQNDIIFSLNLVSSILMIIIYANILIKVKLYNGVYHIKI
ncbi:hypothetical protein pb186bvf_020768 [Paramecium bursaria]